jgi:hypothetical protein
MEPPRFVRHSYGTMIANPADLVIVVNFIQRPLPEGSTTGALTPGHDVPGALGMGQQASTGLTLCRFFSPI